MRTNIILLLLLALILALVACIHSIDIDSSDRINGNNKNNDKSSNNNNSNNNNNKDNAHLALDSTHDTTVSLMSLQLGVEKLEEELLDSTPSCDSLQIGQYTCEAPVIDPNTQSAVNCSSASRTVPVACFPVEGVICNGQLFDGKTVAFYTSVPCRLTANKRYDTALLLSVFLGVFGIDRFYLGYPAIGLLKFCTLGFFLIGYLVDVLLILLQVVKPANGSDYIIPYYGPIREPLFSNDDTAYL